MNIKPALKKRIVALYPDNIVYNLKLMDESLYEDITNVAKENNTTVKTLLESNGFSFSRKSLPQMYIEDYNEVLPLYEDKKVESLHESHGKLYYKLLNHAKLKGFTLKQYLTSLGFEYELKKESVLIPEIKKELEKIYKNKVIVNLSKTNPALYYKVYQSAAKENKTINVFLTEMGFSIPEKQSRHRRTKAEMLRDSNKTTDKTENKTKTKEVKDTPIKNVAKVEKETNTKSPAKKAESKNTTNKTKTTDKTNKTNETKAKVTNKANNDVDENKTKAKAKVTEDNKEVKTKTTPKNSSNTTKTVKETEKETKKQPSKRSTSVRNASSSKSSKNQVESNEKNIENTPVIEVVQETKE